MFKNNLKKELKKGNVIIGTWSVLPSIELMEILGICGFQFSIIDLEHGPFSYETAQKMIIAAELKNITPLVRVPHQHPQEILRALEIGAHGIVVPQIQNKDMAKKVIKSMYYAPMGTRGVSAYTRSSNYNSLEIKNRTSIVNKEVLSMILIENVEAINNLDEILTCENLDIVYLGTYDLSHSLGKNDNLHSKEILTIIEKSVNKINKAGKYAGILAQSLADVKRWKSLGIKLIAYQVDCGLITQELKTLITKINSV